MPDQTAASQLRFEIVGDNSQLKAAFAEIEKTSAKTAESTAAHFEASSSSISTMFKNMQTTLSSVDKAITEAMDGGAAGVENSVVGAFNKAEQGIKKSLDSMVSTALSKFGILGKGLAAIWPSVSSAVGSALDDVKKSIADKLESALNSDTGKAAVQALGDSAAASAQRLADMKKAAADAWKSSDGLLSGLKAATVAGASVAFTPATEELTKLGDEAQKAKERVENAVEGLNNAFGVLKGERMAGGAFGEITEALEKNNKRLEEQLELVGKNAREAAKIKAQRIADEAGAGGKMADDQKAEIDKAIEKAGATAGEIEDKQKGIRQAEQLKNILASLQERLELEMATTQEIGKTTAEVARQQAEARFNLQIAKAGITLTAEQVKLEKDKIDAIEKQVQLKTEAKVNRQINEQGQQELIQIRQRMDAFGQSAGAQAEAAFTAKAYADSIKQVGYVTDDVIKTTERWAPAIRQATDAQEAMKRNFQTLQDSGQVVARGLETAFAKWTEGGKVSVREMVADMMANMAQLAFKNSVSQLLFGASGNASNGGGLFGSLGSTLFGGMREAGGPVTAGVPYVVGEKRPELFVPKQSGYIMPTVPQTSAQRSAPNINLSIDARGATADAVEKLRAQIPGIIMGTMREAQSRGAFA